MKPEKKLTDITQFLIRKKERAPVWGVEELDEKWKAAVDYLGDRWLLDKKHSPQKKDYSGWPK